MARDVGRGLTLPGVGIAAKVAFRAAKGIGKAVSKIRASKWRPPKNVTDKFPSSWVSKPNRKGVGTRWQDPNNPGSGVRIDRGNPNHSFPTQQVDHVVVRRNGQVIGRDGNPIRGSIRQNFEQAHPIK